MTTKQLGEAVKAGEALGMVLDGNGGLVLDTARGFKAIMVKTGIGTLTSTDPSAVANLMYTVYKREGDNFKVISSRFGRQTFCADRLKLSLMSMVWCCTAMLSSVPGRWRTRPRSRARRQPKSEEAESRPPGDGWPAPTRGWCIQWNYWLCWSLDAVPCWWCW